MPSNKTININPSLLKVGGGNNSTRKKQPKQKPDVSQVKPNTLKRNLLKRLKQHSSRNQKEAEKPKVDPTFSSEFEKGLEYLNKLKTTKKNKTLKKKKANIPQGSFVSLDLPPELREVTQELPKPTTPAPVDMTPITSPVTPPPYGNLKGGSKPTFREWKNKTQKADPKFEKEFNTAEKINRIKSRFKEDQTKIDLDTSETSQKTVPKKNKHNKTVKATLGKQGGKVSVLIKDNKTRKKVQFEQSNLHSKPISEVKDYLRKKYLLKIGSKAPPEVLRRIYEDVHLTGDVTNQNTETLLHNYVSEST